MARIPTPCAFRYRIVVHASTPSTPSGPPHGRWSTRARLPERLGLVSGDGWVLFPAKSTEEGGSEPEPRMPRVHCILVGLVLVVLNPKFWLVLPNDTVIVLTPDVQVVVIGFPA